MSGEEVKATVEYTLGDLVALSHGFEKGEEEDGTAFRFFCKPGTTKLFLAFKLIKAFGFKVVSEKRKGEGQLVHQLLETTLPWRMMTKHRFRVLGEYGYDKNSDEAREAIWLCTFRFELPDWETQKTRFEADLERMGCEILSKSTTYRDDEDEWDFIDVTTSYDYKEWLAEEVLASRLRSVESKRI